MTELLRDPVDKAFRRRMLEHFGFVLDLIPSVTEALYKKGLDQSPTADHSERDSQAGLGEHDLGVRLMTDEAARAQTVSIEDTDGGVTPSWLANAVVVTGTPRSSSP